MHVDASTGACLVNPAVSVIVPAFNAGLTLNRCLRSLDQQTLCNLEIILVDDGSTDDTLACARAFAQNCVHEFRVVSQNNAGPSAARNHGLRIARGSYIAFADADDEVDPSAYAKMYRMAVDESADIVVCGYSSIDEVSGRLVKEQVPGYSVIRGSISDVPAIVRRVGPLMCDKLFRKSIIDQYNISFAEDLHHAEDFLFISEFRLYVGCVAAVREPLYKYYVHNASSISGGNAYVLDIVESCNRVITLYRQYNVFDCSSRNLLFVLMGYYQRKRRALPRFSASRLKFTKGFKKLFRKNFSCTWIRMWLKRAKKIYKTEGLIEVLKLI